MTLELFDNTPRVKNSKLNTLPNHAEEGIGRFPSWLHRKLPKGPELRQTASSMRKRGLHTVCEEAKCPNRFECWSAKTATFLIMGKECTRSCGFCEIDFAKSPLPLEEDEPRRVAESVKELGLNHVVITMVARDDQPDGGAQHLALVMREVRHQNPGVTIEVLTSDFEGNLEALDCVLKEKPEIFNHNIEAVRAYCPKVRHKATYDRTLKVLKYAAEHATQPIVKSGFMVGFGESRKEVEETLQDLKNVGVEIVTIGQYLQPSKRKIRVKEFVTPETFESYALYGKKLGLVDVYAGPFVRSSYNAHLILEKYEKKDI